MAAETEIGTGPGIWQALKSAAGTDFRERTGLRWHPSEIDDCVAARGDAMPEPLSGGELEELRAANTLWGGDEKSFQNIAKLGDSKTRVVVTGQQPGLLAGPLLVIYKTLAAIKLCAQLKTKHPDLEFVPVFWVASEDHDFEEIKRAMWAGHNGTLEEVLLTRAGTPAGGMVGPIKTAETAAEIANRIEASTHKTDFQSAALELVSRAYGGDADLETGFCRILHGLLAGTGLVIVSPLMAWVRGRSAPILMREFDRPGESSNLVIKRGESLRAQGVEPALHRGGGSINAFWVDGEKRRFSLKFENGKVARRLAGVEEGDALEPLELADLKRMLAENPASFSTNVVTRPLTQDSILPTVAQIAGPGEAAYLAQVEAVYDSFGVFAPVRFPRPRVLMVEPRVERQLAKYKVTLEEALERDATQLAELVLRRDSQEGEVNAVETMQRRQLEELAAMKQKTDADASVQGAFEKLTQGMEKGYAKVLERILYLRQRDEGHSLKAMGVVANSLHPAGGDQERGLNPVVPFAVNHGLDWARKACGQMSLDPALDLQVIRLETYLKG